MGTTTSSQQDPYAGQATDDTIAMIQGMNRAPARDQAQVPVSSPLPDQLQPGYQPQMPVQLAQGGVQTGGPTVGPSQLPPELGGTVVPPGSFQPGRPPGQQVAQNYSVVGSGPGTWWQQQHPQNQPPASLQPAGPGFRYTPPQNSEQPPVRSMPALWNGNQVGPSGQTKQQFLLGRMMHESQGDPTALNYVARANPRAWDAGFTATGILQDTSTTWANGVKWALADPQRYPMSDDPRKYPVAGYAPWDVQWQVNSAIYDHAGETPWRERNGPAGQSFRERLDGGFYDQMSSQTQQYAPAQPRSFAEWGRAPVGMGGSQPGQMPRPNDFGRIMGSIAPLLVGIASLAARMPLSTAITAYGAMARAQQNGQQLEYERNRTRFQDQLKEHNAQQALESQEAGDAFSEYGNNNPQGLQQQLASIALKYNDPIMFRMAEQGDLNGIHELQAKRDTYGQDLSKLEKAHQEQQDRQAQDAAVSAMDRKYQQEHPDATPDDLAIAHNEHIGEAARAGTKDPKAAGSTVEAPVYDVVDKDGNPTGKQVRAGKNGGFVDADTSQPAQIDRSKGERVEQTPRERQDGSGAGAKPKTANFQWTDPEGNTQSGYATMTPGKGLTNPTDGTPIPVKPGTMPREIGTAQPGQQERTDKLYDVVEKQPDGSEQIVQSGVELRLTPNGYVHAEDNKPLELGPNQRVRQTTPTTTTGGRAGAQTLRQMVAAEEVRGDLSGIANLPIGTTVGANGILHPGDRTVWEATLGTLARTVTTQDQGLMEDSMAGIQRELSTLMSPVYGGKYASDQIDALIPKPGDSTYRVLDKLARIRQSADNAITALHNAPWITPDQKKELDEISKGMAEAIPWTVRDVRDFLRQKNSRMTFRDFVGQGGLGGRGGGQGGQGDQSQAKPEWALPDPNAQRRMPDGRPIYSDGKGWFYGDHTPVQ